MNNIKSVFSIKDLENLSGIKAHTIRIWEKRYKVLEPMRTETNIRLYDIANLQKLLNITLLHKHGYKISNIAKLSKERIPELVNEIITDKSFKNQAISSFKMAMINFDQTLFMTTYNNLLAEKSFREVFYEVFLPLVNEMGLLWQTDTISPAHEHFISYLIKQKILSETEKVQVREHYKTNRIFVLYLPLHEIHELGLMFINYEILSQGYKTIYLGSNIPIFCLKDLKRYFDNITYISYMTVEPKISEINNYIKKVEEEILDETSQLWTIGRATQYIESHLFSSKITTFNSIKGLVDNL
ncbi:MerR family transcriptional regulator [Flavobacterium wongokense]|uniref:MerR family transcriptional regulator n=1 Tax=Flavobacterium wongokense TaxID=2910674 RepID=UPI001F18C1BB|nr:MerR family transcriptional regulator [Flavobacterium sp. WG47]MCF6132815.1 MerR family transcriptional regulator [Flavobacterium sp. WG47]